MSLYSPELLHVLTCDLHLLVNYLFLALTLQRSVLEELSNSHTSQHECAHTDMWVGLTRDNTLQGKVSLSQVIGALHWFSIEWVKAQRAIVDLDYQSLLGERSSDQHTGSLGDLVTLSRPGLD